MAFHVACPITCRRICSCPLGFPPALASAKSRDGFLAEVRTLDQFLRDPWGVRVAEGDETVRVAVPRIALPPPLPEQPVLPLDGGDDEAAVAAASAHAKRAALQRRAAATMVAAEDYARRFESSELDASRGTDGEEQARSGANVMCRICFFGENEKSERARKMLSCKSCGKKYHKNCVKNWAQHRDLFHWSSWTCPSCRICEVCRRVGDPNKFMFCKRCDGAYHCYCQHPSHKNVSSGPYLCPKHTKCHSCGSSVPGNGLSVRWFLGYTCCDACGRLFVKGNYCPVCLKVYRDSESTPMVCCDLCQRWVHCQCDGISDEKYLQFQVNNNLQYKCATCRGECYQVTDLDDAVKELWRRKDKDEEDLIASLRAASGLPTQEEIFSISPFSDDEENGPVVAKNEYGRSLKLSLKGMADNSPKKTKDYGKKYVSKSKKGSSISKHEVDPNLEARNDEVADSHSSPAPEENGSNNKAGVFLKRKSVDEVMVSDEEKTPRVVRIKSSKSNDVHIGDNIEKDAIKSKSVKGKKLVINLGARKINVTSSPRSDASTGQREQELLASNGSVDASRRRTNDKSIVDVPEPERNESSGQSKILKFGSIKLGKVRSSVSDHKSKVDTQEQKHTPRSESNDDNGQAVVSNSTPKDVSKPLLRFKFKKPNMDNQNSASQEEEKSSIKGQRSKRKRPSNPFGEKISINGADDATQEDNENLMNEIMDANWILQKLGKDAVGKLVEVHQPSDNSWHKGVVADVADASSKLSVRLDDGRTRSLELGKQGVRFVSQKPKKSKT